jgi:hypothetical protein
MMTTLLLLSLWAHDEKISRSEIVVHEDRIVWRVTVAMAGLHKVIRLPAEPVDLSEAEFQSAKGEIVGYLKKCLALEIDGRRVEPEAGPLEPKYEPFFPSGEPYIAHARQEFVFPAAGKVERILASFNFFRTLTDSHRALVHVLWGDRLRSFSRVGEGEIDVTYARMDPSFWMVSGDFILWGMHHIFIGYDHIAFLLALLLAARRVGEMVKIVTSFTVAHSITLLLAAFDVLRIEPKVTEALIAASIVYVAAENFFVREAKYRWAITFGFGLVHGLGFSSVLRDKLVDVPGSVVVPVLAFNVGVEVGQLAILLVAFPLLGLARGRREAPAYDRRHRLALWIGSSLVGLAGLVFLTERLFDVEIVSPWLG